MNTDQRRSGIRHPAVGWSRRRNIRAVLREFLRGLRVSVV